MAIKKPAPKQGRNIKVLETTRPDSNYPVFCFRHLVKGFDLEACSTDETVSFVQQLVRLSKLTWDDIRLSHRHGAGSEKIARTSIRAPIPSVITEDVSFFLSLRFQGLKAFIGHRDGNILHVIWIDSRFSVYKH